MARRRRSATNRAPRRLHEVPRGLNYGSDLNAADGGAMRAVCRAMLMGAAVLAAASTAFTQAPNTSGTVLYEGARLIVGDGSAPIPSGDLLVSNGRIAALGPRGTLKVPRGHQRLDLIGKTIIPAFNN